MTSIYDSPAVIIETKDCLPLFVLRRCQFKRSTELSWFVVPLVFCAPCVLVDYQNPGHRHEIRVVRDKLSTGRWYTCIRSLS